MHLPFDSTMGGIKGGTRWNPFAPCGLPLLVWLAADLVVTIGTKYYIVGKALSVAFYARSQMDISAIAANAPGSYRTN